MRVAALCLTLASMPGQAGAMTAEGLLDQCIDRIADSQDEPVERAYCAGFMRGAIDSWRIAVELGGRAHFCLPDQGVTVGDAVVLLGRFVEANEASARMPAAAVLLVALRRAYPCED